MWQTMVEHFSNGKIALYADDCIAVLAELGACSIDSCVTAPPYPLTAGKKGGTGPLQE